MKIFLGSMLFPFMSDKRGYYVLTFHSVPKEKYKWFEFLIDFIDKEYGFFNPDEIENILNADLNRPNGRVLLTFDDGFFSNRRLAEKILKPRNIKAIFFVTEGFIGLKEDFAKMFVQTNFYPNTKIENWNNYEFNSMSFDDLLWLKNNGHTIGAHTSNHPLLSRLSMEEKQIEMVESANRLENKLGVSIKYFAYPFGSPSAIDKESISLALNRFKVSFTNIRGNISECHSRGCVFRQNIPVGVSKRFYRAIIEGKIDWVYHLDRKKVNFLNKLCN